MIYTGHVPSPPLNSYIDDLYYLDGPALHSRLKMFPLPSLHLMVNFGQVFSFQSFIEALGLSSPVDWGDSTAWQYWVMDFVRHYEQQQGYERHPIGMTMQVPVPDQASVNDVLWNSPADWISPGYDDEIPNGRWVTNPPENQGRKWCSAISDGEMFVERAGTITFTPKTTRTSPFVLYLRAT